jgi:hypothetical protein
LEELCGSISVGLVAGVSELLQFAAAGGVEEALLRVEKGL